MEPRYTTIELTDDGVLWVRDTKGQVEFRVDDTAGNELVLVLTDDGREQLRTFLQGT